MSHRATESIDVLATPQEIYDIAIDFAHYPSWASDVKKVEIVSTDEVGRATEVTFRAAAFGRSTTYTLAYNYDQAPRVLSWSQTAGDLTEILNGSYRFEESPDGTTVTYELEVELLVPIPNFIKSRAASRIQFQALRELKAKAEHSK